MGDSRKFSGPLIVALFATICMLVMLEPMRSVIMWAAILAVIFTPTNDWMKRTLNGPNRAALATLVVILLTVIIPFVLIALVTSGQISDIVSNADKIVISATNAATALVDRMPDALRREITDALNSIDVSPERIAQLVLPALNYSFSIGSNILVMFGALFAVLYVAFFFLRDGRAIMRFLSAMLPLRHGQKEILQQRVAQATSASVQGVILVAAAQAFVAGVIYALLGIEIYAVLGALTFVACLIPAIGSGLVWVPIVIYFFITGDVTKGAIMLGSGLVIIGSVDNILRPRLIAEKAALPDFLIFLSSFGGLAAIGFDGLFLGPIVAAFFVEAWKVFFGVSGRGVQVPLVAHDVQAQDPGQGPGV